MIIIKKYNHKIDSLIKLTASVKTACRINKNFFGEDIIDIVVNFLYSRDEMDEVMGRKTQDWLVGDTYGIHINIFSPAIFNKVSSRPPTDFMPILIHETAHVFTNSLYGYRKNPCPVWLREGIAGYVAKQYKKYNFKKMRKLEFNKITSSKDWNVKPNYPQAFLFTKYLIDKYGKEVISDLLKFSCKEQDLSNFPKIFKKITKDNFEQVSNNWLNEK